jgi:hypothetical protein
VVGARWNQSEVPGCRHGSPSRQGGCGVVPCDCREETGCHRSCPCSMGGKESRLTTHAFRGSCRASPRQRSDETFGAIPKTPLTVAAVAGFFRSSGKASTYSSSPPVMLPTAASGNSKVPRRAIVRAGVIGRLARAASLEVAASQAVSRDSPSAIPQGPGNRCLETMDGSMRGKALFPVLGTMSSLRIHLRRKASSKQTTNNQPTNEHRRTD